MESHTFTLRALGPLAALALLAAVAASQDGVAASAAPAPPPAGTPAAATGGARDGTVLLTPAEIERSAEFSPLPDPPADPTNAVADDPAAALLGQGLFYDGRLSSTGDISCSTCHMAERGWSDGRQRAFGVAATARHAPTLWNVAYNRWFFWDGRKDSLWSQALAPLEDVREHAISRLEVAHLLADDERYAGAYEQLFGPLPKLSDSARFPAAGRPVADAPDDPDAVAWASMSEDDRQLVDEVFANAGKAIAAFVRRIVTRRAPFDVFVEGLRDGDASKLAAIGPAAQRGFSLFLGKGQCFVCHDGPNFTDLEFHSNRVPTADFSDGGRAVGIQTLLADPFNLASRFADDGGRTGRTRLSIAPRGLHYPGEFKTPTLRNVATTAPYMHDGQFASLAEVIAFYSTLENASPPDPTGERLILPRDLTPDEQADLVAFLESLTDDSLPTRFGAAPESLVPAAEGR